MTLNVDPEKNNKKYFVIPKGTLPIDYYNADKFQQGQSEDFEVILKNVDISSANLIYLSDTNNVICFKIKKEMLL